DDGLVQNSATVGAYLKTKMSELLDHPLVGDVRGQGRFLGIEFVQDKDTKAVLPQELGFSKRVQAACLAHGLVALGARGTVDNLKGDHMLFAPPLILNNAQADELVASLRKGLNQAAASI
ncbi:MAG: aminotransferase class III-fold pyridoxal phosphate-dependent enzyme, partial [Rhodobacterales bacterium]|nr:aminotransferase class III-fold pyridoxal phosphate-dependent enzyme [Rhodobacterales bacterium]